jgi:hypothetical protein
MAELAQLDLRGRGREARVRALLEDLTEYHKGIYPHNRLALAVWFRKSPESQEQQLLELFSGEPKEGIAETHFSLLWKAGYVNLRATSTNYFLQLLTGYPEQIAPYRDSFEVLYFDKKLLNPEILDTFHVITEPPGLLKGWYVSESEYAKTKNIRDLLSAHSHTRPEFGLVKTEESADFENCRGLMHTEVSQKWVPFSPEGIKSYTYYNDAQVGTPVYFLFEGGSLYKVLKFEVKTVPEYSSRLLGKTRDDRYPEVYLRAVRPPEQSAT